MPFVLSLFALWCVFAFSSHSVQIAPRPENGPGPIWSAISFGLVGGILGLIATQNDKTGLPKSVIAFGTAAAIGAVMLYGPVAAAIHGSVDFPSSTTREYRTFLPILHANHRNGRTQSWWVRLAQYNVDMEIVGQDYRFMDNISGKSAGTIASNNYFCADVVIQQSGGAIRIMHTTVGALHPHSIVVCPIRATNR